MEFTAAVMILLTFVIAAGTIASAIAIGFQWYELHEGGFDTAAIATAAKQQACAAKQIAEASKRNATAAEGFAANASLINGGIGTAVKKLDDQARATQQSANAAKEASITARQEMEISQRPWLVVKASIASDLTYNDNGGTITLHYTILNVGHTPALKVNIWPEFYVANGKKIGNFAERERFCEKGIASGMTFGQTIYPGQVFEQNQRFSMSQADIDDSWKSFGSENVSKVIPVSIIDCVTYRSNFTETLYTVADSYFLGKANPQGMRLMIQAYKDMAAGSLVLMPEEFSPVSAK
jgi:hypothetical protein